MRRGVADLLMEIYFSYGQFMVFDKSIKLPGCAWTEQHYQQGFARREMNVCFGTLLEFGRGDVSIHLGSYKNLADHQRAIEVPINVPSGEIVIAGPEEIEDKNVFTLSKGAYRLVAAQTVIGDDRELLDLYFEKLREPLSKSRILVGDDVLHDPNPLLESVEVA